MIIEDDVKLDFSDVLIRPKRSILNSRNDVDLLRDFRFPHSTHMLSCVPIIAANMYTTGTVKVSRVLGENKMLTCLSKHIDSIYHGRGPTHVYGDKYFISHSCGMDDRIREISDDLYGQDIKMLTLDVANGYTQKFLSYVQEIRDRFPDIILFAGNVATPEMTEALILAGADVVKVGIGNGAVCTTRKITGIGYPQLSAVIECADAAHGIGGHIVSDGGCVVPGDIAKAFGAGADFVMLGSMFAGHDECQATTINDKQIFYGMSSKHAQEKHNGGLKEYRASEGKVVQVPHRGPIQNTVNEILGGLRSACSYVGAREIKDLPKCTTFVRVSRQLNESFNKYEVVD